ncbi:MAG: hypothetical protein J6K48_05590 [Lachnospiraceae bacterium]|nr:hypothetical protein [Lachnospiraceae bacterium]
MDKIISEMRVNALHRVILPIVICLLISPLFFMIGLDSYKRIESSNREFSEFEEDELHNSIVHLDANFVLDCFAEYGSAVPYTREISETDKCYYIVYCRNGKYIAVEIDAEEADSLDEICEATWDYLMGYTDNLEKSYTVEGTVSNMTTTIKRYYIEWFEEMGFSDKEIEECALPYVVRNGWNRNTELACAYIGWGIFLILAVSILILLMKAVTQHKVKKDFARLGTLADTEITEDYANACVVNNRVRIGRIFTYDCSGLAARVYLNDEIIWVYRTEAGRSNKVHLWDIHGKGHAIKGDMQECSQAINFYEDRFPYIVIGFSTNLRQLFHRDRQNFLTLRYNDGKQNENSHDGLMEVSQDRSDDSIHSDNP